MAMVAQGRPTVYSEELAGRICNLISEGMSLRKVCELDDIPGRETINRWLTSAVYDDKPEIVDFRCRYARARDEQTDLYAEEIIEISDNPTGDVNRDRLRVDARKWVASKLKPKKYGDRVQTELTGADGGALQIEAMPSAEMARRLAFIFAQAQIENAKTITQGSEDGIN